MSYSSFITYPQSVVQECPANSCLRAMGYFLKISRFMKKKYTYTGFLGDIAKESIEVALSYIKSNCKYFDIDEDYFTKNDIHIHFTENGISKDGPSAGIAITTAILSLIKDIKIDKTISMTGELTLKGEVLRVASIKEKAIASLRNEINKLLVPYDNISDVETLDQQLKENINFIYVNDYKEIYEILFK